MHARHHLEETNEVLIERAGQLILVVPVGTVAHPIAELVVFETDPLTIFVLGRTNERWDAVHGRRTICHQMIMLFISSDKQNQHNGLVSNKNKITYLGQGEPTVDIGTFDLCIRWMDYSVENLLLSPPPI